MQRVARQGKSRPNLNRAIVLPLEGKGDRFAVDEVTCTPAPLRGAFLPNRRPFTTSLSTVHYPLKVFKKVYFFKHRFLLT